VTLASYPPGVATSLAPSPSAPEPSQQPRKRRRRWPFFFALGGIVIAATALFAAVVEWSGAKLDGDPSALARIQVETFGGVLESARAVDPNGRAISVAVVGGRLTPEQKITPGTQVTVEVVMRRPGWDAWLIGKTRTERLTIHAPLARVNSRWATAPAGSPVEVAFSEPVTTIAYGPDTAAKTVTGVRTSYSIPTPAPAGSVRVAIAARSWERLGPPVTVRYFPRTKRPAALITPTPGGRLDPGDQLRLTFSRSVRQVLGKTTPKLTPNVPGTWKTTNSHTLVFTPSGFGAPLGSHVQLTLGHTVAAADATGHGAKTTRVINWTVPAANPLRLVQLLADTGYLPVDYKPTDGKVARTARAQASAAADPPKGHFVWRFKHTPPELKHQWVPNTTNVITRGAIMMYEDEHHLAVDGVVGPVLWKTLLSDAIAGKRRTTGYNYVFVHRNVPQLMSLWHNGKVIVTSPGNTGVPAAPTDLGTFPVFEHLSVTTMSGTNPDGSKYNDPGIPWVSYFNGGDALHAFPRASFGTPQSLGCVELPLAAAAKIWPYTPIGTLVTIEN
jgi:hypothetical protein